MLSEWELFELPSASAYVEPESALAAKQLLTAWSGLAPEQVVQRVPLSYTDPFGAAVVSGYSSFSNPATPAGIPAAVTPKSGAAFLGNSILQPNPTVAPEANSTPKTRMQKIEMTESTSDSDSNGDTTEQKAEIDIKEELLPPAQNSEDVDSQNNSTQKGSAEGSKADWKIHWNPLLTREA